MLPAMRGADSCNCVPRSFARIQSTLPISSIRPVNIGASYKRFQKRNWQCQIPIESPYPNLLPLGEGIVLALLSRWERRTQVAGVLGIREGDCTPSASEGNGVRMGENWNERFRPMQQLIVRRYGPARK